MHILALLTDGFGGTGGIAKFNRDLLTALCADPRVDSVVALPRVMPAPVAGPLPAKLDWRARAAGGKLRYLCDLLRLLARPGSRGRPDLVVCGHLNLLPLAALAARRWRVPLWQILHGIEAWQPPQRRAGHRALGRINRLIAVSQFTRDRFVAWSGLDELPWFRLPNCVDLAAYGPGPKLAHLLERYGLREATVIMTLGRLSAAERYKGLDEVLDVMPRLLRQTPNLCYLICGDGDDRPRLVEKARSLGLKVVDYAASAPGSRLPVSGPPRSPSQHFIVSASSTSSPPPPASDLRPLPSDLRSPISEAPVHRSTGSPPSVLRPLTSDLRPLPSDLRPLTSDLRPLTSDLRPLTSCPSVIFTGRIPEEEKADHYRLADAFVMIGRGEGFGIVYLEALACGIPVVGSKVDGSREALLNGQLGILVDPANPDEIKTAIRSALQKPPGQVVAGLDYFSYANFQQRSHDLVASLV